MGCNAGNRKHVVQETGWKYDVQQKFNQKSQCMPHQYKYTTRSGHNFISGSNSRAGKPSFPPLFRPLCHPSQSQQRLLTEAHAAQEIREAVHRTSRSSSRTLKTPHTLGSNFSHNVFSGFPSGPPASRSELPRPPTHRASFALPESRLSARGSPRSTRLADNS